MTVENCGRQLTFDRPPSRAYLGYQAAAEMFIGLGLADHAIARKKLAQPPLPDQADAFARIPENSVDPYKLPDKETLTALRLDFLLAFVEFGGEGHAAGAVTLDDLATVGTQVYDQDTESARTSTVPGHRRCRNRSPHRQAARSDRWQQHGLTLSSSLRRSQYQAPRS